MIHQIMIQPIMCSDLGRDASRVAQVCVFAIIEDMTRLKPGNSVKCEVAGRFINHAVLLAAVVVLRC